MNVLIEMGHPAHVHFFSGAISRLKSNGHSVRIVTRSKEITDDLLRKKELPFTSLSVPQRGKARMLMELMKRWKAIARIIRKESIDVAVSISGISTSLPARVCGIRNILFTDTEDAQLSNRIAFPFADRIYTPGFYLNDLGKKHRRYSGLHELAYLQNFDFEAASETRKQLGLPERYSLVRIVGNDALHDEDIQGIDSKRVEQIIRYLSRWGEVFISSQNALPETLAKYRIQTPIEKIHAVMAGALLFIGESPTMAVESSLLGVPAFLVSGRVRRLGNMVGLERDHQLLRCYLDADSMFQALPGPEELPNLQQEWAKRAEAFRQQSVDMTQLIYGAITEETS